MLSQFTAEPGSHWGTLADHIDVTGVYAAGRLDADSEGLLLLTSRGALQQRLTDPRWGHWRRYWVQVEGIVTADSLAALAEGVIVQRRRTLPARATGLADPLPDPRDPPIRHRRAIPTSWLQLELREGRNRQVRRMTAAVGLPTLRLIRTAIDLMDGGPALSLDGLAPGRWRPVSERERQRLETVERSRPMHSPGRGGREGGGNGGQAGGSG